MDPTKEGTGSETVAELLLEAMRSLRRPTMNQLAHRTCVSTSSLSRIISGYTERPDYATVDAVAQAFPKLADRLYRAAGYAPPSRDTIETREALRGLAAKWGVDLETACSRAVEIAAKMEGVA